MAITVSDRFIPESAVHASNRDASIKWNEDTGMPQGSVTWAVTTIQTEKQYLYLRCTTPGGLEP